MLLRWSGLWSTFLGHTYRKPLTFCLGVLLMAGVSVTHAEVRLVNISTRAPIQDSANDVVVGFIITGTSKQKVLIRGWGLSDEVNPSITLYSQSTEVTAYNND